MESNQVALVTGAGSGIGAAIAAQLLSRGWRVIAAGRNPDKVEPLAALDRDNVLPLRMDIREDDSVIGGLESIPRSWADISVVVNCAGHAPGGRKRFDLSPLSDRLATVDTNLAGVMRVCHVMVPKLIARGGGDIINIGSVAGQQAARDDAAYTASKFGLRGFTEGLRLDLVGTNVRVTEVRPGLTLTRFAETRLGDADAAKEFYERMDGVMHPKDVADCVMFALSAPRNVTLNEIVVHPTNIAPNR